MAKLRSIHRCSECGASTPKWVGKCPACNAWNTLVEDVELVSGRSSAPLPAVERPVEIPNVDIHEWVATPTGIGELDRVLSGGLVPGSVTLVGGEPGVGKSTLLLQASAAMAKAGRKVLYISAEESRQQVRLRADRLGAVVHGLWLGSDTVVPSIVASIEEMRPDVVIIDSIQTVHDPELGSAPGSVVQVRESAHKLVREAKIRGIATLLVGHVTKDGGLAGPRVLEHVVDTVLSFEGERHHALRMLRATKHRFGSTAELGLFEMLEHGLEGVPDPSGLFLADRQVGIAGSVVVPTMEGHRPLLVEIQALVAGTGYSSPKRSAQGVDPGRLGLLLAVIEQRAMIPVGDFDVFASAVGGVKVVEPGSDLALALAVVSSLSGMALPGDLVACGEIGLGGELRQAAQTGRRLAEAARLGFHTAVVPASAPDGPEGMTLIRGHSLREVIEKLGLKVPESNGRDRRSGKPGVSGGSGLSARPVPSVQVGESMGRSVSSWNPADLSDDDEF